MYTYNMASQRSEQSTDVIVTLSITLVFPDGFYNFCVVGNRNEYTTKKLQNITSP